MARCGSCNKFVGFEEQEPEVDQLEVDEEGTVSAEVKIVNCCAECGDELREASFTVTAEHELGEHKGEGHQLEVEEQGSERTNRSGYFQKGKFVPSGGRYAKTFYGFTVEYSITCSCQSEALATGMLEDDIQASSMDEC